MRFSRMTLPNWLTHLFLAGIALVAFSGTTYAEQSDTHPRSPHSQLTHPGEIHGMAQHGRKAAIHPVNFEGYGSPHGSPHHGMGHSGFRTSPHGSGHPGGFSGGGSAHGSSHPGPHQSADAFIDHMLKFKDGMGITDKQETALRALETNFKKTRIRLKAESDLANLELHDLLRNDKASMSDIESKLKNVHEIKATLYLASIKARRDAKAVLSDEQRSRMETIHERIKTHGSKMKGYSRDKSPHGDMPKHGG